MKLSINYKLPIVLCLLLILVASCGTVNRFTRVKKTPREYSMNYCGVDNIKAPKTELNKEPWIVYSDRDKNTTYTNPGGKVKLKSITFLDPFLVIKQDDEYLQLIKYTPDVLKNGKLDYKKAEYYGWISKSKLLLTQQSVTDLASGKKNKMMVMLSDINPVEKPERYFANDSIFTFQDYKLETPAGTVAPYEMVYQLKQSPKGDKILIAKKPVIKAEEVKSDVLGWISRSMLKNIGQGLHVDINTIPPGELQLAKVQNPENPCVTESVLEESYLLSQQHKTTQYSPVTAYKCNKNNSISFCPLLPLPVLDNSANYISNINGGHITYKDYKQTVKELRKINVAFVFERGEKTMEQFPQLVNVLQNLQPLFEQNGDLFRYQFACVLGFDETATAEPTVVNLTADYSKIANGLAEKANKKLYLASGKTYKTWAGLQKAVKLFDSEKEATNFIVVMGEKGDTLQANFSGLYEKMRGNNCRLLGFQVYSDAGNTYNNFVLDIETMINNYADNLLKTKGDSWVSPQQRKRTNNYIEIGEDKNNFRLDFPENSATQGGILFPAKGEMMALELLSSAIDTILLQIKEDNRSLTKHMTTAFGAAGSNRTRFDSRYVDFFGMDAAKIPSKKFLAGFKKEMLGWYLPAKPVTLNDTENNKVGYRLLLSENELTELKEFVTGLSAKEVDIRSLLEPMFKDEPKKPCDCPDDNALTVQAEPDSLQTKDSVPFEYRSTKKIRKYLYTLYMNPLRTCKVCKEKKSELKQLTLAEAQRRITGCPTADSTLNTIRLRELKKKKIVTDKQLDELIQYFKSKKDELDKAEQFNSNGETYFWVDKKLLP